MKSLHNQIKNIKTRVKKHGCTSVLQNMLKKLTSKRNIAKGKLRLCIIYNTDVDVETT
jgi:hypothetical protein